MGTQKLLLPCGGQPMIARIVDVVCRSPVDRVFVIVGRDAVLLTQALPDRPVQFVRNPDPASPMLDSVRCGLRALPAAATRVLVVLGDQPGVTVDVITRIVRAEVTPARAIVVPVFNGRRGHPLLFAIRYGAEILNGHDAVGLRGLLAAHPEDIVEVPVATAGVLDDMDTPEDYRRMGAD